MREDQRDILYKSILEDPYPDIATQPYFVKGGVSTSWQPSGDTAAWHPPRREPRPWTCHYCGNLNPADTWNCSHCPAPRKEPNKVESSIWQPPIRVVAHEEMKANEPVPTPGLDWVIQHPDGGVLQDKPPLPAWAAFLIVGFFLATFLSGAMCLGSLFVGVFPVALVLASVCGLCYYILKYTSRAFKRRYDWGDK